MIEIDKMFAPICRAVDSCYEGVFPGLPMFPKFCFVRTMATLWRDKVYSKLNKPLLASFIELMKVVRETEISAYKKNLPKGLLKIYTNSRNSQLIARFIQTIADLSINELTIHYLGSTKADLDQPCKELHDTILEETK
eukprot:TRINITY_DN9683_c0_g2_i3.p2 TRINITY_DN9683_c0_g2~~TRINITY_DN9683_c0_g2_i3.p2  ORF type:complete len:138 (-),score=15.78 TRINITY_DN9683_c0_g2_i3:781-1194(-)